MSSRILLLSLPILVVGILIGHVLFSVESKTVATMVDKKQVAEQPETNMNRDGTNNTTIPFPKAVSLEGVSDICDAICENTRTLRELVELNRGVLLAVETLPTGFPSSQSSEELSSVLTASLGDAFDHALVRHNPQYVNLMVCRAKERIDYIRQVGGENHIQEFGVWPSSAEDMLTKGWNYDDYGNATFFEMNGAHIEMSFDTNGIFNGAITLKNKYIKVQADYFVESWVTDEGVTRHLANPHWTVEMYYQ